MGWFHASVGAPFLESPHLELRLIACVGQQDIVSHPTLRRIDLYFRAVLTIVPGGKL